MSVPWVVFMFLKEEYRWKIPVRFAMTLLVYNIIGWYPGVLEFSEAFSTTSVAASLGPVGVKALYWFPIFVSVVNLFVALSDLKGMAIWAVAFVRAYTTQTKKEVV